MLARTSPLFTHPARLTKLFAGMSIALVAFAAGWYFFAEPVKEPAPTLSKTAPQNSVSAAQLTPVPAKPEAAVAAASEAVVPQTGTPEVTPKAAPEDPFTPLLQGNEHESFKDYVISAMAAGATPGTGIAVINGKVLHEGDKLGLAQLVRIGSDSLIFSFDKRYYVLYPRQEPSAGQQTPQSSPQKRAQPRKGKP